MKNKHNFTNKNIKIIWEEQNIVILTEKESDIFAIQYYY